MSKLRIKMITLMVWIASKIRGYPKSWMMVLSAFNLETGRFTDYKCKPPYRNLMGMRYANVRPNRQVRGVTVYSNALTTDTTKGYATYSSYWNAINDYYDWCDYKGMTDTDNSKYWFDQLMKKNYHESGNGYRSSCESIHEELKAGWITTYKAFRVLVIVVVPAALVGLIWFVKYCIKVANRKQIGYARK